MAVPPAVIDEIRNRADLLGIIGDYVSLKKAGRNFIGLCPFHSEKTPSFSVSPDKGFFHCFGCGAGGDVFAFLKRIENISFGEALEKLANRYGIEIPKRPLTVEERSRGEDRERIGAVVEEAAALYHRLLTKEPGGEEGREYLKKRGYDIGVAKQFRIGWAPREWDWLIKNLTQRGFNPRDVEKSGLVVEKSGGGHYDRFRGRVMFPIISVQDRVLGFGGRIMGDDEGPKYMNSPESALYQKSRVLYGLNAAQKAIRDKDAAIIVEGYFDALALFKAGFENVVAPCGTALTVEQVEILKRYTKNLYPLFDADEAGDKARARSLEVILKAGASAKNAVLPQGMDPDDLIAKQGPDALVKILDESSPLLDYTIEKIVAANGTTVEGLRKSMAETAELIAMIADYQLREMYIGKFGQRFGPGGDRLLRKEVQFKSGRSKPPSATETRAPKAVEVSGDMPEYYLTALLLTQEAALEFLDDDREVLDFIGDPVLKSVIERIVNEGTPKNPTARLEELDEERFSKLSKLIVGDLPDADAKNLRDLFARTALRIKLARLKSMNDELNMKLGGANETDMPDLLRRKNELLTMEKILKAPK